MRLSAIIAMLASAVIAAPGNARASHAKDAAVMALIGGRWLMAATQFTGAQLQHSAAR